MISQTTISLFLPPSQMMVHPFTRYVLHSSHTIALLRFYTTSPRSPALHFAIAKQLIIYNLLHIVSSIVLCVDITSFGFNYSLTSSTRNLLVFSNMTGVPCIFLSLLILFRFYSRHDLWTSQGVHLVYVQDLPTVLSPHAHDPEHSLADATQVTVIKEETVANGIRQESSEPEANSEVVEYETPRAESTTIGSGGEDEDSKMPLNTEQDDSAEADRDHLAPTKKSLGKVTIQRTSAVLNKQLRRSCCSLVTDVATVEVGSGRWVDVSD